MTLSSFRVAPRQGHMDRAKRVVGYLSKMKHATIRFRTERPDLSDLVQREWDWSSTPCGGAKEEIPDNIPEERGNEVDAVTYVDANLMHDYVSGKSVSGILHFINKTPMDWHGKKLNTVETSTYSSEFAAARIATDQIVDLRNTLRYVGVPVRESVMFGDSKSVNDNSVVPHSTLKKRHNALSHHRVREAIAAKIYRFFHTPGEDNPADVLSKHWSYGKIWKTLQPILFWQGDTMELIDSPQA